MTRQTSTAIMEEKEETTKKSKKPQTDKIEKTPLPYDLNSNDNPENVITQCSCEERTMKNGPEP